MPYALNQPLKKDPASYAVFKNVFSATDCRAIIELAKQIPKDIAATASLPEKRTSEIHWIEWQEGVDNIFKKLAETILMANDKWWNFHLGSFMEPLQLTHYLSENSGHYDWHEDRCDVGIAMNRKISGSLILNDNYEGGDFELFDTKKIEGLIRGSLILFPSYKVHRVLPVTKGERWSLVFWVTGPPFV